MADRKRQRKSDLLPALSPLNAYNNWCWASPKPRAANFIQVFHIGDRDQINCPFVSPDTLAMSWIRSRMVLIPTSTLVMGAPIASGSFSCCTTMLTPFLSIFLPSSCFDFYSFVKSLDMLLFYFYPCRSLSTSLLLFSGSSKVAFEFENIFWFCKKDPTDLTSSCSTFNPVHCQCTWKSNRRWFKYQVGDQVELQDSGFC